MPTLTTAERVFLVKRYFKNGESVEITLRKFSSTYKNRPRPHHSTLKLLIDRWERTGSVCDDNTNKGHPVTVRTPEKVDQAAAILEHDPNISHRRLAQAIGTSRETARIIMRKDLQLFPYKIQLTQYISPAAISARLDFANLMIEKMERGEIDFGKIIFSDEAHFHLEGYVNRQNMRFWGTSKPDFSAVTRLHPKRVTVWLGINKDGYVGPYFFESSINAEDYLGMLKNTILPSLVSEHMIQDYWWQQDGATIHRTTGLQITL